MAEIQLDTQVEIPATELYESLGMDDAEAVQFGPAGIFLMEKPDVLSEPGRRRRDGIQRIRMGSTDSAD